MVKMGESRMSHHIEDELNSEHVTPIKKQGDSDSSQYIIRTDIKAGGGGGGGNMEDKHSPNSIITDSMASKVGIGSGGVIMAGQEEAKAAFSKLSRKSASTHQRNNAQA
jgi:hypothetical protein